MASLQKSKSLHQACDLRVYYQFFERKRFPVFPPLRDHGLKSMAASASVLCSLTEESKLLHYKHPIFLCIYCSSLQRLIPFCNMILFHLTENEKCFLVLTVFLPLPHVLYYKKKENSHQEATSLSQSMTSVVKGYSSRVAVSHKHPLQDCLCSEGYLCSRKLSPDNSYWFK